MTVPPTPVPMPKANPTKPLTRLVGYDVDGRWGTTKPDDFVDLVAARLDATIGETMVGVTGVIGAIQTAITTPSALERASEYLADALTGIARVWGARSVATAAILFAMPAADVEAITRANDEAQRQLHTYSRTGASEWGPGIWPIYADRSNPSDPECEKTIPWLGDIAGHILRGAATSSTQFERAETLGRKRTTFAVMSRGDVPAYLWHNTRRLLQTDAAVPVEPMRSSALGRYQRGMVYENFDVWLVAGGWNYALHVQAADCRTLQISVHATSWDNCEIAVYVDGTHSANAPALVRPDGRPLPERTEKGADRHTIDGLYVFGVGSLGLLDVGGVRLWGRMERYGQDYRWRIHSSALGLPYPGLTCRVADLTVTWVAAADGNPLHVVIPASPGEVARRLADHLHGITAAERRRRPGRRAHPAASTAIYDVAPDGEMVIYAAAVSTGGQNTWGASAFTVESSDPAVFAFGSVGPVEGANIAPLLGGPDDRGSTGTNGHSYARMILSGSMAGRTSRPVDIDPGRDPFADGQQFVARFDGYANGARRSIRDHIMDASCRIQGGGRPLRIIARRVDNLIVDGWTEQGTGLTSTTGAALTSADYYGPLVTPVPNPRRVTYRSHPNPRSAYCDVTGINFRRERSDRLQLNRLRAFRVATFGVEDDDDSAMLLRLIIGRVSGEGGLRFADGSGNNLAFLTFDALRNAFVWRTRTALGEVTAELASLGRTVDGQRTQLASSSDSTGGLLVNATSGIAELRGPVGLGNGWRLARGTNVDIENLGDGIKVNRDTDFAGALTKNGEPVARLIDIPDFSDDIAAAEAAAAAAAAARDMTLLAQANAEAAKAIIESAAFANRLSKELRSELPAASTAGEGTVAEVTADGLNTGLWRVEYVEGVLAWKWLTAATTAGNAARTAALEAVVWDTLNFSFTIPGFPLAFMDAAGRFGAAITDAGGYRTADGIEFVSPDGRTHKIAAAAEGIEWPVGSGNIVYAAQVPGMTGLVFHDIHGNVPWYTREDGALVVHTLIAEVYEGLPDGLGSGSGGAPAPSAGAREMQVELALMPILSQSPGLGSGAENGLSTTPGWMFNGGVRPQDQAIVSGGDVDSPIPPSALTSLVQHRETRTIIGSTATSPHGGETPLGGAVRMLYQLLKDEDGIDPDDFMKTVAIAPGRGGKTAAQLAPGSVYWDGRVVPAVEALAEIAAAEGKTWGLPAALGSQGEADYGGPTPDGGWTSTWLNIQSSLEALVAGNGGRIGPIPFIFAQVCSHEYYGRSHPSIALEQLQLCDSNPNWHMAVSPYFLDPSVGSHLNALSYLIKGAYLGLAYKRITVDKIAAPRLRIASSEVRSGGIVYTTFATPASAVAIDRVRVSDPGNAGVRVVSPGGAVRPITVAPAKVGPKAIKFMCPTAEPGDFLTYGHFGGGTGVNMGRLTGSRGCIRDNQGDRLVFDPTGYAYPMHNWLPICSVMLT